MIILKVLRWKYKYTTLGPKTVQQNFPWNIGPVDNRPSTDQLLHFVKKKIQDEKNP